MLHVALFEPEIPPNTGNIIRLCANTGALLHLIEPLGFDIDDKKLRRAGLDYHEWADIKRYKCYEDFSAAMMDRRIFACSTHAKKYYSNVRFQDEDVILFGPETRGLPKKTINELALKKQAIKIPMLPHSRSLNLSNSVAIILLEAWKQIDYIGLSNDH